VSQSRVYVSFDVDHDQELYQRLLGQARGSTFYVSGESEFVSSDRWNERARCRIREADQMIVICGEHSEASVCMSAEIRIAQEEKRPYFLLWGRGGAMCKKPVGAKSAEGMYKWTRDNLEDQVSIGVRRARTLAAVESRSRQISSAPAMERCEPIGIGLITDPRKRCSEIR
jgi:hypothetical protein